MKLPATWCSMFMADGVSVTGEDVSSLGRLDRDLTSGLDVLANDTALKDMPTSVLSSSVWEDHKVVKAKKFVTSL